MNDSFSFQFLQLVENALEQLKRIPSIADRILVACSGGPDSVVLLDTLIQLSERHGFALHVCHVNHGLRGDESNEDEELAVKLADQYGIPMTVRRFERGEIEEIKKNNLEEYARQLRYEKLENTAIELDCTYIATGHTRSDQAETVLHRIIRSSGLTGLSGILPLREDMKIPVIRPLIKTNRDKILQYAKVNGLSFRHDSMNDSLQFTRVQIRKKLIPFLKSEYNPQIEDALSNLASLAQEDEQFWSSYVENLYLRVGYATEPNPADRKRFLHLSKAEQKRLMRYYCKKLEIDPSLFQVENALDLLYGERPQSEIHLSAQCRLYRRYDDFYFAPPLDLHENIQEYSIQIPGETIIQDLGIKMETVIVPANVHQITPSENHSAEFDAEKVRGPVVIRTRREGDVIRPLGMTGSKKIKKFFQEKRIPLEQREQIPLLCFDEDLAWIAGMCVSDTYRIDANTKNVLIVSIHPLD